MIDYSNEIFTHIADPLRVEFDSLTVAGEYTTMPAKFPCVTIEETGNIPSHLDSADLNRYADITYRVQVFSNKVAGKRAEARAIFSSVDSLMQTIGLRCTSYSSTPDVYNSSIYQITAIYAGTIDTNGNIYRK